MDRSHAADSITHSIIVGTLSDIAAPYVRDRNACEVGRSRGGEDLVAIAEDEHERRGLTQLVRHALERRMKCLSPDTGNACVRPLFADELERPLEQAIIGARA